MVVLNTSQHRDRGAFFMAKKLIKDGAQVIDLRPLSNAVSYRSLFKVTVETSSKKGTVVKIVFSEESEPSLGLFAPREFSFEEVSYEISDPEHLKAIESILSGVSPRLVIYPKGCPITGRRRTSVEFQSSSAEGQQIFAFFGANSYSDKPRSTKLNVSTSSSEVSSLVSIVPSKSPSPFKVEFSGNILPPTEGALTAINEWQHQSGLGMLSLIYDGDGKIFLAAPTGGSLLSAEMYFSESIGGSPISLSVPWEFVCLWEREVPQANRIRLFEEQDELFLFVSQGDKFVQSAVSESDLNPFCFEDLLKPDSIEFGFVRKATAMEQSELSILSASEFFEEGADPNEELKIDFPFMEFRSFNVKSGDLQLGKIPENWKHDGWVLPIFQFKKFLDCCAKDERIYFGYRKEGNILLFFAKKTGVAVAAPFPV